MPKLLIGLVKGSELQARDWLLGVGRQGELGVIGVCELLILLLLRLASSK